MTHESLTAGRELDILIAERVFGMNRLTARVDPMNRNGEPQFHWGYPMGHDFAPEYSTDVRAAWLLVEAMRKVHGMNTFSHFCQHMNARGTLIMLDADELALLICASALKAVEETVAPTA